MDYSSVRDFFPSSLLNHEVIFSLVTPGFPVKSQSAHESHTRK